MTMNDTQTQPTSAQLEERLQSLLSPQAWTISTTLDEGKSRQRDHHEDQLSPSSSATSACQRPQ
jgi:hypothetical protein